MKGNHTQVNGFLMPIFFHIAFSLKRLMIYVINKQNEGEKMKLFSLLILSTILAHSAVAGECSISVDRKACPGKESDALKPYDGKNPTEEKIAKATTAENCTKEGEKAAKIARKGTLAKKTVTISFDGKKIGEKSAESECK